MSLIQLTALARAWAFACMCVSVFACAAAYVLLRTGVGVVIGMDKVYGRVHAPVPLLVSQGPAVCQCIVKREWQYVQVCERAFVLVV
eukprot:3709395-Pleurochrysis_carterae.AAC.2